MTKVDFSFKSIRMFVAVAVAITSALGMIKTGGSIWATFTVSFLLMLAAAIKIHVINNTAAEVTHFVLVGISSVVGFYSMQYMMGASPKLLSDNYYLLGMVLCLLVVLILVVITGRCRISSCIAIILMMILATADYVVYEFRGTEITPFDFLSLTTAWNVAGEYTFCASKEFILAWDCVVAVVFLVIGIKYDEKVKIRMMMTRGIGVLLVCVLSVYVAHLSEGMLSYRWANGGAANKSIIGNFFLELKESRVEKPEGYDYDYLAMEMNKYADSYEGNNPNIIVIMNESFADLRDLSSELKTSEPVTPFIDSLEQDTIKGGAYSSVFGGGTSSSEFEFLTGNSMAFLPDGSIPYQQFVAEDMYSIVSVLEKYGYVTEAFHPYHASGWNRENAYSKLGFDKCMFIDAFPQDNLIRGYISDQEMYEVMVDEYERNNIGKPVFMFGVTMQNHGGYLYEDYGSTIKICEREGEYPDAEQYLSLIHESDNAFRYLVDYFGSVSDDTIILMFGDHQPGLSQGFYDYLTEIDPFRNDIAYDMEYYKIPFIMWANYDIKEYSPQDTSINYLSDYIFEETGIDPAYGQFLKSISTDIPIVTANSYYSKESAAFKEIDEATGDEKAALDMYMKIQYNNLFDSHHKLQMFKTH